MYFSLPELKPGPLEVTVNLARNMEMGPAIGYSCPLHRIFAIPVPETSEKRVLFSTVCPYPVDKFCDVIFSSTVSTSVNASEAVSSFPGA